MTKLNDTDHIDNEDMFSIKAQYLYFYKKKFLPPTSLGTVKVEVLEKVWFNWASSNVVVFSWKTLLGRLPRQ
jgi:hypothetical protein